MKIAVLAFSVLEVPDYCFDQIVDDPSDPAAVKAVLQQMVDAGDRSIIHGWDHLAELQIDDVQIDEVPS